MGPLKIIRRIYPFENSSHWMPDGQVTGSVDGFPWTCCLRLKHISWRFPGDLGYGDGSAKALLGRPSPARKACNCAFAFVIATFAVNRKTSPLCLKVNISAQFLKGRSRFAHPINQV